MKPITGCGDAWPARRRTSLNLILFTIPTVTITADVVEFLE